MANKTKQTRTQSQSQKLGRAIPGKGGRFYRDADGLNIKTEQEHLAAQKAAAKKKQVSNNKTDGETS